MKVNFYATLRQIVGVKTVEVDAPEGVTIRELLLEIARRYPALSREMFDKRGNLHAHIHVFINGRESSFIEDNLDARVQLSDTISVFPAVGGG